MTAEMWLIAAVRVAGSLPVLRWPFAGAIIAMLVDLSDLFIMYFVHLGGVHNYQEFDKYLDQVYMLTFLAVALRWEPVPRAIAVALYVYRLAGVVAFEVVGGRDLLIVFPNVFEFWFVFVAGAKFFRLEAAQRDWRGEEDGLRRAAPALVPFRYSRAQLGLVLPLLLAAKLVQEYALHVGRWFDSFTTTDMFEWMWDGLSSFF